MIKQLLKVFFAGIIIYWLLSKGHLDFALIGQSLHHPWHWLLCLTLIVFNFLMTSWRWKVLLEIKTPHALPFARITALTWIGMFFSTVLPGAVTGDVIKLVYARDLNPHLTRSYLLTSILLDRLLGMFGLLMVMGIFSLISYRQLIEFGPDMQNLLRLNFFLFAAMLICFSTIFIPAKGQNFLLAMVKRIPKLGEKIVHLLEQFWFIGQAKKAVFICTMMSGISQLGNVFAFWILTLPFYSVDVPFQYAISFIPIGLISVAIPISPSGLGVGHAMFAALFSLVGMKEGASLFNLFFLATLFINLLGVIPYLLIKKHQPQPIEE